MYLTVYQRFILDFLHEIPYIRERNMLWLMRLKCASTEKQLENHLRQLAYLGKIIRHVDSGGFAALPGQNRNDSLIMTADVMIQVCGNSLPEMIRGNSPCLLSFYLRDERGYMDFKIVPVPLGAEERVMEQLRVQYHGFKCTWLFLPESHEQIEKLHMENPACFVFKNKVGGYDFLRKQ